VHRSADGCRAEDVIGARRLLDPGGFKRGKLAYPADGGWHVPDLVGIERDTGLRTNHLACDPAAAHVVFEAATDLELDKVEAIAHRVGAKRRQPVVGVTEPAGRRRVRGVTGVLQPLDALRPPGQPSFEQLECVARGKRVDDVAEIDQRDDLRRREVREQPPERFARTACGQVPARVQHRPYRHVHHATLGAEPAKRAIEQQPA